MDNGARTPVPTSGFLPQFIEIRLAGYEHAKVRAERLKWANSGEAPVTKESTTRCCGRELTMVLLPGVLGIVAVGGEPRVKLTRLETAVKWWPFQRAKAL